MLNRNNYMTILLEYIIIKVIEQVPAVFIAIHKVIVGMSPDLFANICTILVVLVPVVWLAARQKDS